MVITPLSATAALARSHALLRSAVASVGADQWQARTPCADWTVGQVAQHAALDQQLYAATLTGAEPSGADPFHPSGEFAGAPAPFVDAALTDAETAFAAADGEELAVPMPPFALPARLAHGAAALDAAVHAWDISVAVGAPLTLDEDLAAFLAETASVIVEPVRAWGAYAAPLAEHAGESRADALLRYLGRDPHWS